MKSKKETNKRAAVNQKANPSTSKSTPPTTAASDSSDMKGIWDDSRFAHLVSDPRFKSMKKDKKIKIDKRFAGMFKDEKFCVNYSVDKYGRRSGKKSSADDMKKYYSMSSSDESDNDEIEQKEEEKRMISESDSQNLVDSEAIPDNLKAKLKDLSVDYARGEGKLFSDDDSSDDEDSTADEKDELFIEHCWGELDAEAPRTEESTHRLAACNMDWDRIRASDIMVLCTSFLPPGGSIISVTIYPSDYGKERMANEEIKGPQELTKNANDTTDDIDSASDKDDEEEGVDFNMENLRQYQLNRLKYYYAVIECDRVSTADKLYAECDGLEYESTATKLDLRFIPNEMAFDNDVVKDVCTELPDMSKYMPRLFTTTALQQAKVELTWDENDVDRKELNDKLVSGKFNEVADQELRKYVAYSSSEDSDESEENPTGQLLEKLNETHKIKDPIKKYKALLEDIHAKEEKDRNKRIEMEYSWHIGGGGKETEILSKNEDNSEDKNKTHFDKILEYKQQKKKQRKDDKKKKMKLLKNSDKSSDNVASTDNEDDDDDLPDGIDMNDSYFAEEFANGDFVESKKKLKKKSMKINSNDDDEQKLAELELLMNDDDDDANKSMAKGHFSLQKIQSIENESKTQKRKKKLKKRTKQQNNAENALLHQDDFHINVNDSRFSSIYSSHLYNIDPTHANYKKTNAMEALIKEKLNRRPSNDNDLTRSDQHFKVPKTDVAVNLLVKSIKRKIKNS